MQVAQLGYVCRPRRRADWLCRRNEHGSVKQEPLSTVWEVKWCQCSWAARSGSKSASAKSRKAVLYCIIPSGNPTRASAKHSALNRDNTVLKPAFLPLDGLLRCHRDLGNNVAEEYSTQQPGKSQGYNRRGGDLVVPGPGNPTIN